MKTKILAVALLTGLSCGQAGAQTVDYFYGSSLSTSTQYYTESVSMGPGSVIVTSGGGNAANVGDPTGRNDDGFSGPITLNFDTPFSFFGNSYTTFYANNNGNITFGSGNLNFTPNDILPGGAALPIISPFFADVDTRNTSSGVMRLNQTIQNQTIVTWDSVGYYNQIASLRNSFQLVLRGADYSVPAGEGQIGFFWKTMEWTTGNKSGGSSGFAIPNIGTAATVGFGDGLGSGLMLDVSLDNSVAATVQDHHVWFNVDALGVPVVATASPPPPPVPEPETYAMLLAGLGLLGFTARRRKRLNA